MGILLGYEVGTGEPVYIPEHHLIATGLTRLSGKTTTLEALIKRSGLRGIIFKTKIGEIDFPDANKLPLFYREKADWLYVEGLLEARLRERLKFERGFIIEVCKGARSLRDVYENIKLRLLKPKLRDFVRKVYTELLAYFELVLPELEKLNFVDRLELKEGLNVMDLTGIPEEVQMLIIHSVLDYIYENERNVILVLPEVWKLCPQGRMTPIKPIAEHLIREGGARGIWLWMDAQDITGVDKRLLKSVDVWLLGRQREINEINRILDQIPLPSKSKPKPEEIMRLPVGFFYTCFRDEVKLVYVQPSWLPTELAVKVAKGELSSENLNEYKPKVEEVDMEKIREVEEKLLEISNLLNKLKNDLEETKEHFNREIKRLEEKIAPLIGRSESIAREVTLESSEIAINVKQTEPTHVNLTTETIAGKIIYCAVNDLEGEFSPIELWGRMVERGWNINPSTLKMNLGQLVKQGLLVRTEKGRYRLPSKVKVNVEG